LIHHNVTSERWINHIKEKTMKTIKPWITPLGVGLTLATFALGSTTFAAQGDQVGQPPVTTRQDRTENQHSSASHIYKASQLIDATVENAQGDNLGEIEEIVVDPADGSIAYAVLAAGGFLGLGEKYFAIPWRAFQPQADDDGEIKRLTLDVDKERFQNAPGFDKDQWPDMADPQWGQTVHSYYGQQDYWANRQAMRQSGQQGMSMPSAQTQQTDVSATVQKINGTTVELQAPQDLLKDLQAGDQVKVSVQKQADGMMHKSHPSTNMKDEKDMQKGMQPKN
jgi:sporulation protein YlmC with PRC-barrel domain